MLYILTEANPPWSFKRGWRFYGWSEDVQGESVWLRACDGRCVLVCNRLGLVPWPGWTWPYVEARRLSVSAGVFVSLVKIWPKLRLNSSLYPLSQRGITYGTMWPGCDGNTALDRTIGLNCHL